MRSAPANAARSRSRRRSAAGRLAHKAIELEVAGREERDPHSLVEQAAERLREDGAFPRTGKGSTGSTATRT